MWGYKIGDPQQDLSFDDRDNAHAAPLAVAIDPAFTWGDDRPPQRPIAAGIIGTDTSRKRSPRSIRTHGQT
jgi:glycogen operon protein